VSDNIGGLRLEVEVELWPMTAPFRITGHVFEALEVVVVRIGDGVHEGRGEAAGVYYKGDTLVRMSAEIEGFRPVIEAGIDGERLRTLMPPGGARNAVDCALWDLAAQCSGQPAWTLAGLAAPRPLLTTYTLGAEPPEAMARQAQIFSSARALKLKLTGEPVDAERVRQVRAARPDVWMAVDANQGFTPESLDTLMPVLVEAEVQLLEQPFRMDRDDLLAGLVAPMPVAADESCQDLSDVARLAGLVDVINIKLDKCGGLTEGLAMAREAKRLGLKVMVGNMLGTSLAMAPAFLLGQLCDVVDLDGPMSLVADRVPPVTYAEGLVWCEPNAWGAPRATQILGAVR
jgi:L-alanine-DL-glutamate epimerase-like enolase superfamily enzyme